MPMLKILVVAVGMTVGSLLTAALLTYLAWWVAGRIHHRRWVWALLLGMIGGIWFAALGHSEFFKMAAVFGLVASAGLYFAAQPAGADSSRDEKHRLARPGSRP